jgi:hypothetical protein
LEWLEEMLVRIKKRQEDALLQKMLDIRETT